MINYYIEKDGQIKLFDTDKQRLKNTLLFMPDLQGFDINETQRPIVDSSDYTHFVFADTEEYLTYAFVEAQKAKISEINEAKETAFKGGFYFNDSHFDCDDRAQIRLAAQLTISQPGDTIVWLDYDYNPTIFTYEQFVQMCAVATSIVSNIEFETSKLLESAQKATTIEELDSIQIDYNAVVMQVQNNTESEENNE